MAAKTHHRLGVERDQVLATYLFDGKLRQNDKELRKHEELKEGGLPPQEDVRIPVLDPDEEEQKEGHDDV